MSQTHGATPPFRGLLEFTDLHDSIQRVSAGLYRDGHFASAVLEAFKILELRVQERSGTLLTGRDLMSKAFGTEDPVLSVAVEPEPSGTNEQEGFKLMLMGAMVGIRNPKAHHIVNQRDPIRTLELLAFASLLLHRVDAAIAKPVE